MLPFVGDNAHQEEALIIENLIKAYISEMDRLQLLPAAEAADRGYYELSGTIEAAPEGRTLGLRVLEKDTGSRFDFASTYRSLGEMALGVRGLLLRAVGENPQGGIDASVDMPDELREERVLGTWRGDRGIEMVRLMRGGTGIAFFSSGVQMGLSYTIAEGYLVVAQSSPNNERYYHPVPYKVARRLSEEARPMVWKFRLYEEGTVLRGDKTATAVAYERDEVLHLIHDTTRPAEWTKITR